MNDRSVADEARPPDRWRRNEETCNLACGPGEDPAPIEQCEGASERFSANSMFPAEARGTAEEAPHSATQTHTSSDHHGASQPPEPPSVETAGLSRSGNAAFERNSFPLSAESETSAITTPRPAAMRIRRQPPSGYSAPLADIQIAKVRSRAGSQAPSAAPTPRGAPPSTVSHAVAQGITAGVSQAQAAMERRMASRRQSRQASRMSRRLSPRGSFAARGSPEAVKQNLVQAREALRRFEEAAAAGRLPAQPSSLSPAHAASHTDIRRQSLSEPRAVQVPIEQREQTYVAAAPPAAGREVGSLGENAEPREVDISSPARRGERTSIDQRNGRLYEEVMPYEDRKEAPVTSSRRASQAEKPVRLDVFHAERVQSDMMHLAQLDQKRRASRIASRMASRPISRNPALLSSAAVSNRADVAKAAAEELSRRIAAERLKAATAAEATGQQDLTLTRRNQRETRSQMNRQLTPSDKKREAVEADTMRRLRGTDTQSSAPFPIRPFCTEPIHAHLPPSGQGENASLSDRASGAISSEEEEPAPKTTVKPGSRQSESLIGRFLSRLFTFSSTGTASPRVRRRRSFVPIISPSPRSPRQSSPSSSSRESFRRAERQAASSPPAEDATDGVRGVPRHAHSRRPVRLGKFHEQLPRKALTVTYENCESLLHLWPQSDGASSASSVGTSSSGSHSGRPAGLYTSVTRGRARTWRGSLSRMRRHRVGNSLPQRYSDRHPAHCFEPNGERQSGEKCEVGVVDVSASSSRTSSFYSSSGWLSPRILPVEERRSPVSVPLLDFSWLEKIASKRERRGLPPQPHMSRPAVHKKRVASGEIERLTARLRKQQLSIAREASLLATRRSVKFAKRILSRRATIGPIGQREPRKLLDAGEYSPHSSASEKIFSFERSVPSFATEGKRRTHDSLRGIKGAAAGRGRSISKAPAAIRRRPRDYWASTRRPEGLSLSSSVSFELDKRSTFEKDDQPDAFVTPKSPLAWLRHEEHTCTLSRGTAHSDSDVDNAVREAPPVASVPRSQHSTFDRPVDQASTGAPQRTVFGKTVLQGRAGPGLGRSRSLGDTCPTAATASASLLKFSSMKGQMIYTSSKKGPNREVVKEGYGGLYIAIEPVLERCRCPNTFQGSQHDSFAVAASEEEAVEDWPELRDTSVMEGTAELPLAVREVQNTVVQSVLPHASADEIRTVKGPEGESAGGAQRAVLHHRERRAQGTAASHRTEERRACLMTLVEHTKRSKSAGTLRRVNLFDTVLPERTTEPRTKEVFALTDGRGAVKEEKLEESMERHVDPVKKECLAFKQLTCRVRKECEPLIQQGNVVSKKPLSCSLVQGELRGGLWSSTRASVKRTSFGTAGDTPLKQSTHDGEALMKSARDEAKANEPPGKNLRENSQEYTSEHDRAELLRTENVPTVVQTGRRECGMDFRELPHLEGTGKNFWFSPGCTEASLTSNGLLESQGASAKSSFTPPEGTADSSGTDVSLSAASGGTQALNANAAEGSNKFEPCLPSGTIHSTEKEKTVVVGRAVARDMQVFKEVRGNGDSTSGRDIDEREGIASQRASYVSEGETNAAKGVQEVSFRVLKNNVCCGRTPNGVQAAREPLPKAAEKCVVTEKKVRRKQDKPADDERVRPVQRFVEAAAGGESQQLKTIARGKGSNRAGVPPCGGPQIAEKDALLEEDGEGRATMKVDTMTSTSKGEQCVRLLSQVGKRTCEGMCPSSEEGEAAFTAGGSVKPKHQAHVPKRLTRSKQTAPGDSAARRQTAEQANSTETSVLVNSTKPATQEDDGVRSPLDLTAQSERSARESSGEHGEATEKRALVKGEAERRLDLCAGQPAGRHKACVREAVRDEGHTSETVGEVGSQQGSLPDREHVKKAATVSLGHDSFSATCGDKTAPAWNLGHHGQAGHMAGVLGRSTSVSGISSTAGLKAMRKSAISALKQEVSNSPRRTRHVRDRLQVPREEETDETMTRIQKTATLPRGKEASCKVLPPARGADAERKEESSKISRKKAQSESFPLHLENRGSATEDAGKGALLAAANEVPPAKAVLQLEPERPRQAFNAQGAEVSQNLKEPARGRKDSIQTAKSGVRVERTTCAPSVEIGEPWPEAETGVGVMDLLGKGTAGEANQREDARCTGEIKFEKLLQQTNDHQRRDESNLPTYKLPRTAEPSVSFSKFTAEVVPEAVPERVHERGTADEFPQRKARETAQEKGSFATRVGERLIETPFVKSVTEEGDTRQLSEDERVLGVRDKGTPDSVHEPKATNSLIEGGAKDAVLKEKVSERVCERERAFVSDEPVRKLSREQQVLKTSSKREASEVKQRHEGEQRVCKKEAADMEADRQSTATLPRGESLRSLPEKESTIFRRDRESAKMRFPPEEKVAEAEHEQQLNSVLEGDATQTAPRRDASQSLFDYGSTGAVGVGGVVPKGKDSRCSLENAATEAAPLQEAPKPLSATETTGPTDDGNTAPFQRRKQTSRSLSPEDADVCTSRRGAMEVARDKRIREPVSSKKNWTDAADGSPREKELKPLAEVGSAKNVSAECSAAAAETPPEENATNLVPFKGTPQVSPEKKAPCHLPVEGSWSSLPEDDVPTSFFDRSTLTVMQEREPGKSLLVENIREAAPQVITGYADKEDSAVSGQGIEAATCADAKDAAEGPFRQKDPAQLLRQLEGGGEEQEKKLNTMLLDDQRRSRGQPSQHQPQSEVQTGELAATERAAKGRGTPCGSPRTLPVGSTPNIPRGSDLEEMPCSDARDVAARRVPHRKSAEECPREPEETSVVAKITGVDAQRKTASDSEMEADDTVSGKPAAVIKKVGSELKRQKCPRIIQGKANYRELKRGQSSARRQISLRVVRRQEREDVEVSGRDLKMGKASRRGQKGAASDGEICRQTVEKILSGAKTGQPHMGTFFDRGKKRNAEVRSISPQVAAEVASAYSELRSMGRDGQGGSKVFSTAQPTEMKNVSPGTTVEVAGLGTMGRGGHGEGKVCSSAQPADAYKSTERAREGNAACVKFSDSPDAATAVTKPRNLVESSPALGVHISAVAPGLAVAGQDEVAGQKNDVEQAVSPRLTPDDGPPSAISGSSVDLREVVAAEETLGVELFTRRKDKDATGSAVLVPRRAKDKAGAVEAHSHTEVLTLPMSPHTAEDIAEGEKIPDEELASQAPKELGLDRDRQTTIKLQRELGAGGGSTDFLLEVPGRPPTGSKAPTDRAMEEQLGQSIQRDAGRPKVGRADAMTVAADTAGETRARVERFLSSDKLEGPGCKMWPATDEGRREVDALVCLPEREDTTTASLTTEERGLAESSSLSNYGKKRCALQSSEVFSDPNKVAAVPPAITEKATRKQRRRVPAVSESQAGSASVENLGGVLFDTRRLHPAGVEPQSSSSVKTNSEVTDSRPKQVEVTTQREDPGIFPNRSASKRLSGSSFVKIETIPENEELTRQESSSGSQLRFLCEDVEATVEIHSPGEGGGRAPATAGKPSVGEMRVAGANDVVDEPAQGPQNRELVQAADGTTPAPIRPNVEYTIARDIQPLIGDSAAREEAVLFTDKQEPLGPTGVSGPVSSANLKEERTPDAPSVPLRVSAEHEVPATRKGEDNVSKSERLPSDTSLPEGKRTPGGPAGLWRCPAEQLALRPVKDPRRGDHVHQLVVAAEVCNPSGALTTTCAPKFSVSMPPAREERGLEEKGEFFLGDDVQTRGPFPSAASASVACEAVHSGAAAAPCVECGGAADATPVAHNGVAPLQVSKERTSASSVSRSLQDIIVSKKKLVETSESRPAASELTGVLKDDGSLQSPPAGTQKTASTHGVSHLTRVFSEDLKAADVNSTPAQRVTGVPEDERPPAAPAPSAVEQASSPRSAPQTPNSPPAASTGAAGVPAGNADNKTMSLSTESALPMFAEESKKTESAAFFAAGERETDEKVKLWSSHLSLEDEKRRWSGLSVAETGDELDRWDSTVCPSPPFSPRYVPPTSPPSRPPVPPLNLYWLRSSHERQLQKKRLKDLVKDLHAGLCAVNPPQIAAVALPADTPLQSDDELDRKKADIVASLFDDALDLDIEGRKHQPLAARSGQSPPRASVTRSLLVNTALWHPQERLLDLEKSPELKAPRGEHPPICRGWEAAEQFPLLEETAHPCPVTTSDTVVSPRVDNEETKPPPPAESSQEMEGPSMGRELLQAVVRAGPRRREAEPGTGDALQLHEAPSAGDRQLHAVEIGAPTVVPDAAVGTGGKPSKSVSAGSSLHHSEGTAFVFSKLGSEVTDDCQPPSVLPLHVKRGDEAAMVGSPTKLADGIRHSSIRQRPAEAPSTAAVQANKRTENSPLQRHLPGDPRSHQPRRENSGAHRLNCRTERLKNLLSESTPVPATLKKSPKPNTPSLTRPKVSTEKILREATDQALTAAHESHSYARSITDISGEFVKDFEIPEAAPRPRPRSAAADALPTRSALAQQAPEVFPQPVSEQTPYTDSSSPVYGRILKEMHAAETEAGGTSESRTRSAEGVVLDDAGLFSVPGIGTKEYETFKEASFFLDRVVASSSHSATQKDSQSSGGKPRADRVKSQASVENVRALIKSATMLLRTNQAMGTASTTATGGDVGGWRHGKPWAAPVSKGAGSKLVDRRQPVRPAPFAQLQKLDDNDGLEGDGSVGANTGESRGLQAEGSGHPSANVAVSKQVKALAGLYRFGRVKLPAVGRPPLPDSSHFATAAAAQAFHAESRAEDEGPPLRLREGVLRKKDSVVAERIRSFERMARRRQSGRSSSMTNNGASAFTRQKERTARSVPTRREQTGAHSSAAVTSDAAAQRGGFSLGKRDLPEVTLAATMRKIEAGFGDGPHQRKNALTSQPSLDAGLEEAAGPTFSSAAETPVRGARQAAAGTSVAPLPVERDSTVSPRQSDQQKGGEKDLLLAENTRRQSQPLSENVPVDRDGFESATALASRSSTESEVCSSGPKIDDRGATSKNRREKAFFGSQSDGRGHAVVQSKYQTFRSKAAAARRERQEGISGTSGIADGHNRLQKECNQSQHGTCAAEPFFRTNQQRVATSRPRVGNVVAHPLPGRELSTFDSPGMSFSPGREEGLQTERREERGTSVASEVNADDNATESCTERPSSSVAQRDTTLPHSTAQGDLCGPVKIAGDIQARHAGETSELRGETPHGSSKYGVACHSAPTDTCTNRSLKGRAFSDKEEKSVRARAACKQDLGKESDKSMFEKTEHGAGNPTAQTRSKMEAIGLRKHIRAAEVEPPETSSPVTARPPDRNRPKMPLRAHTEALLVNAARLKKTAGFVSPNAKAIANFGNASARETTRVGGFTRDAKTNRPLPHDRRGDTPDSPGPAEVPSARHHVNLKAARSFRGRAAAYTRSEKDVWTASVQASDSSAKPSAAGTADRQTSNRLSLTWRPRKLWKAASGGEVADTTGGKRRASHQVEFPKLETAESPSAHAGNTGGSNTRKCLSDSTARKKASFYDKPPKSLEEAKAVFLQSWWKAVTVRKWVVAAKCVRDFESSTSSASSPRRVRAPEYSMPTQDVLPPCTTPANHAALCSAFPLADLAATCAAPGEYVVPCRRRKSFADFFFEVLGTEFHEKQARSSCTACWTPPPNIFVERVETEPRCTRDAPYCLYGNTHIMKTTTECEAESRFRRGARQHSPTLQLGALQEKVKVGIRKEVDLTSASISPAGDGQESNYSRHTFSPHPSTEPLETEGCCRWDVVKIGSSGKREDGKSTDTASIRPARPGGASAARKGALEACRSERGNQQHKEAVECVRSHGEQQDALGGEGLEANGVNQQEARASGRHTEMRRRKIRRAEDQDSITNRVSALAPAEDGLHRERDSSGKARVHSTEKQREAFGRGVKTCKQPVCPRREAESDDLSRHEWRRQVKETKTTCDRDDRQLREVRSELLSRITKQSRGEGRKRAACSGEQTGESADGEGPTGQKSERHSERGSVERTHAEFPRYKLQDAEAINAVPRDHPGDAAQAKAEDDVRTRELVTGEVNCEPKDPCVEIELVDSCPEELATVGKGNDGADGGLKRVEELARRKEYFGAREESPGLERHHGCSLSDGKEDPELKEVHNTVEESEARESRTLRTTQVNRDSCIGSSDCTVRQVREIPLYGCKDASEKERAPAGQKKQEAVYSSPRRTHREIATLSAENERQRSTSGSTREAVSHTVENQASFPTRASTETVTAFQGEKQNTNCARGDADSHFKRDTIQIQHKFEKEKGTVTCPERHEVKVGGNKQNKKDDACGVDQVCSELECVLSQRDHRGPTTAAASVAGREDVFRSQDELENAGDGEDEHLVSWLTIKDYPPAEAEIDQANRPAEAQEEYRSGALFSSLDERTAAEKHAVLQRSTSMLNAPASDDEAFLTALEADEEEDTFAQLVGAKKASLL